MASAIKRVNTITQIVRLRQVVQRWKTKSTLTTLRRRTPSGSVAIYVGPDRIRFVVQTRFLNLPVFAALLHEAEEEFGFQTTGGLVLPCEPGLFVQILNFLEKDEEKFSKLELDEFLKMVTDHHHQFNIITCKEESSVKYNSFTPLLVKTRV